MARLPSLNALRAFEAGARHLSFTKAAEELNVTQAAISHQVKALEADLGVALFRRFTRRLELTPAGRRLLPPLGEAFGRIGGAVEELRRGDAARPLTVSLLPGFAGKWLVPRLSRFHAAHPEIDLRLHHTADVADFERDEADLAVRWGGGGWRGVESEFLKLEIMTPVCSPRLLEGEKPLRRPEDLRHHTLLHDYDHDYWGAWLNAMGIEGVEVRRGPVFDDENVVVEAAIDGQGVALGDIHLLDRDLASGRLVQPFDLSLPSDYAYYIVYPPGALERPKVRAFRDFLLAEAAREAPAQPARK